VSDETKVFRPSAELIQAASRRGNRISVNPVDPEDKATEVHHVSKELIYKAREARAAKRRDRSGVRKTANVTTGAKGERSVYVADQNTVRPKAGDQAKNVLYGVWLLAALLGVGLIGMLMIGY
jgi:hypothetical protein